MKDKKKKIKKKIIFKLLIPFTSIIAVPMALLIMISSVMVAFFGSSTVNTKLSDSQNEQLLQYIKDQTEWINNYNTFCGNKRLKKLSDYNHIDEQFKQEWPFTLAFLKYSEINRKHADKLDFAAEEKYIDKVIKMIGPTFKYKKMKITTKKKYKVNKENDKKDGQSKDSSDNKKKTVPEKSDKKDKGSKDTWKTETKTEYGYFLISAKNIQSTYEITYKTSTNVTKDNDETITVKTPAIASMKQIDKNFDNLKAIIEKNYPGEDPKQAKEAICLCAENYIDDDTPKGYYYAGSSTYTGKVEHFTGSQQDFIDKIVPAAIKSYQEFGVLPSITLAQAILESTWGESGLTQRGNALFGVKATARSVPNEYWKGKTVSMSTGEQNADGSAYRIVAAFRAYDSWNDSIMDHGRIVGNKSGPYAARGLLQAKTFEEQAYILVSQKPKYATDVNYTQKLVTLINTYNLSKYDKEAGNT